VRACSAVPAKFSNILVMSMCASQIPQVIKFIEKVYYWLPTHSGARLVTLAGVCRRRRLSASVTLHGATSLTWGEHAASQ